MDGGCRGSDVWARRKRDYLLMQCLGILAQEKKRACGEAVRAERIFFSACRRMQKLCFIAVENKDCRLRDSRSEHNDVGGRCVLKMTETAPAQGLTTLPFTRRSLKVEYSGDGSKRAQQAHPPRN